MWMVWNVDSNDGVHILLNAHVFKQILFLSFPGDGVNLRISIVSQ